MDVRGTPFPPYVNTDEERRRWDQSTLLAIGLSARYEEHKAYDAVFVLYTTRWFYRKPEMELWPREDLVRMKAEAAALGLVP